LGPRNHLHEQGTVEADARGRVTLPAGVRRFARTTRFRVFTLDDGRIVLEPLVDVPAREAWLYKNPEAHKALKAGLASAKKEEAGGSGKLCEVRGRHGMRADAHPRLHGCCERTAG
jgi:bifunctional DNA-binding transcriptional regulator/antitoxin component of YhaV-PrlF toxin-antitoxin module